MESRRRSPSRGRVRQALDSARSSAEAIGAVTLRGSVRTVRRDSTEACVAVILCR